MIIDPKKGFRFIIIAINIDINMYELIHLTEIVDFFCFHFTD